MVTMRNVRRFAASGAGPTWAGRATAVAPGERMGPRVRKPMPADVAKAAAAAGNASIIARRAKVDAAPVVTLLDCAKLGLRPDVPMPGIDVPGVVRTVTCEPNTVLDRVENGVPIYKVKVDFVPGETLGRKWLKHPRTSQSQVYVPSGDARPDKDGKKVVHRGSHRIGNVPSDLVPDQLRPIVALMRPDH